MHQYHLLLVLQPSEKLFYPKKLTKEENQMIGYVAIVKNYILMMLKLISIKTGLIVTRVT